ncbi:hypothetical protein [Halopseudomonas salina]|nr:hypothetical protein [Halopseudomonas salina]
MAAVLRKDNYRSVHGELDVHQAASRPVCHNDQSVIIKMDNLE